jgi:lathosterol oxidase
VGARPRPISLTNVDESVDIRQRAAKLGRVTLTAFEALALAGGLGPYFAIGGYFEWAYYGRRREDSTAWKIQPRRFTPRSRRGAEIAFSVFNLVYASLLSGYLAYRVAGDNPTRMYWDEHGLGFGVAMTALYFLGTDFGLYWAHRLMHRPLLFRAIHRWHHRTLSPTAFTASAMHPLEFALYQAVAAAPLFLLPIPVWGVVLTLGYHNVVALFDHSGIDFGAWFPWQPPPRFHDDHHAHFHVNYGQTLGFWDWMFGTWRRHGRVYGEHVFGGQGAPDPAAITGERPERVRYVRKVTP